MYFKKRGLLGFLGDTLGVEKTGIQYSNESSESALNGVNDELIQKNVVVTSEFQLVANQLFNLFNEAHLNPLHVRFWTQSLYVDTQQQIVAVLLDYWNMDLNAYPANLKAIFSAYGIRAATNRQNAIGGFLWDNTKGNLFDHIAWYMDEVLPTSNKYLGTGETAVHPADIKRLLLGVLKSSK